MKDSENEYNKPQCLSCRNEGIDCTYGSATFSTDHSYFVQSCSGPDIPITSIFSRVSNFFILAKQFIAG